MKPKILVLDDQAQYLRSLDRALRTQWDLVLASNLDVAVSALSAEIILVLTDIRLDESRNDDRQGIDFIRLVRSNKPDLPVIAMSALDAPDVEQAALDAGATRFLRKPIVLTDLRRLLTELLKRTGNG